MHAYVVCFDISDDAIRRNVGRILEHYGCRVQRSVFEVSLDNSGEPDALRRELLELIEEEEDDIRFYPLCRQCREKAVNARGNRVASFPSAVVV